MKDINTEILREMARINGWSKHKLKSLRGQLLALETEAAKNAFIQGLRKRGDYHETD